MKDVKIYEACEIEIISLADDVITSSNGVIGEEDDFGYGAQSAEYEW